MSKAVKFSSRDRKIVLATIHLWKVNAKDGFIPDYEIQDAAFELSPDEMRGIRDVVQEVARAAKNSEFKKPPSDLTIKGFEDHGQGLAAIFEYNNQFEFVLNENNLRIRIDNLRKSGIDTSVEEAALAEIVRRGKLAKKIEKEIR